MGWKLKSLAFLSALVALGAGAAIIAIPLLLYAFLPWLLARRRRASTDGGVASPRPLLKYSGIVFLLLGLIAFASGGTFSVVFFAGVGVAILYLSTRRSGLPSSLAPQEESIMLRDRLFPLRWCSVAEVKVGPGNLEKALVALNERFVFSVEKAAAFVFLQTSALTEAEAERKVVGRIRDISKILIPAGAYLLPLEAAEAVPLVRCACQEVKLDVNNLDHALATMPYDSLAVHPRGHLVAALGAYRSDSGGPWRTVARAGQYLRKPVLMWEVVKAIEQRKKPVGPDAETVFLSSLAATRGANIGERIVQTRSDGVKHTVKSLRTPEIELSKAQLRALVRAYS